MRIDARQAGFLLAPLFCLLAPLFVFLSANSYPFLTTEVGILVGLAALPGVAAWLLAKKFGARPALAIVYLGLCFGLILQYDPPLPLTWVLALLVVAAGLVAIVGDKAAFFVAVAAGVHLGSTLVIHAIVPAPPVDERLPGAAPAVTSASVDLPPIVHLLLDEFGGPASIPLDIDGGREFRASLADFFDSSGFAFYPNAFSQYLRTRNSVPNLVNFRSAERQFTDLSFGPWRGARLTNNDYFSHLVDLGYDIDVYQTDYIDFCNTSRVDVRSCRTYPLFDMPAIRNAGISAWQRAAFIRKSLLDTSGTLRMLRFNYLKLQARLPALPDWRGGNGKTGPLSAVQAIDDVEGRIESIRPGDVIFAHLMTPHFPYVYRGDCSTRPRVADWLNRVPFEVADKLDDAGNGLETQNDAASRELRYMRYLEQATCTQSILQRIFDALRNSGNWEQAIVLVHGDHGPRIFLRIPNARNIDELTGDDYRDAYSALFAVKSPSMAAGMTEDVLPLQVLLARSLGLPDPEINASVVYVTVPDSNTLAATPLRGFDR